MILCIVCYTLLVASSNSDMELSKAERKVKDMFYDLEAISEPITESNKLEIDKKKIAFSEKYFMLTDQYAPNEFKLLGTDEQGYPTDIAVRTYINMFYDMFHNKKMASYSFEVSDMFGKTLDVPEFKKGEATTQFAQIRVRKVYSKNNHPFVALEDTLIVNIEHMKICQWTNKSSIVHIGNSDGDNLLDIEQLKANAALAYNRKQYAKAYQIYQSIIERFPKEGDPYYRMAVMLYKRQSGDTLRKKERNRLILEYLDKAIVYGGSETSGCADNMRYWITC